MKRLAEEGQRVINRKCMDRYHKSSLNQVKRLSSPSPLYDKTSILIVSHLAFPYLDKRDCSFRICPSGGGSQSRRSPEKHVQTVTGPAKGEESSGEREKSLSPLLALLPPAGPATVQLLL